MDRELAKKQLAWLLLMAGAMPTRKALRQRLASRSTLCRRPRVAR